MDVDQQQQEDDANKAAAPPAAAAAAVAAVTSGDDDEDDGGEIDEEQLEEYQEMLASVGAHPVSFGLVFFFTGFCFILGNLCMTCYACALCACLRTPHTYARLLIREPAYLSPPLFRTN